MKKTRKAADNYSSVWDVRADRLPNRANELWPDGQESRKQETEKPGGSHKDKTDN